MFFKDGVFKFFANFTGKLVLESLFNKVAGRPAAFNKKTLAQAFLCGPMKFLRAPFLRSCKALVNDVLHNY